MFLAAAIGIFLLVLAAIFYSLSFVFEGKALKNSRIAVAILDAGLILGIYLYPRFLAGTTLPVSFLSVMLISQIFLVILVTVAVSIRSIYRKIKKPTVFDPERRRILRNAILYPFLSFAIGLYGNNVERKKTVDRFYDIPIKDLPSELENFTIAQLSDIHLGKYYSLEDLRSLLERVANAKPDILAITGDVFDDVSMNDDAIKIIDSFCDRFKFGIWYCHGNHEHHRGIWAVERGLQKTRIHWLVNRWESVGISNLVFIGVDYPMIWGDNERFQKLKREYMVEAVENIPEDSTRILLAHHPEFMDDAQEYKIPLTMSGHTHGSQVGIFGIPLFPVFKYTRGMFKHGDFYGYVHVGNGSWFPYRFGCPPEIAYFKLIRK